MARGFRRTRRRTRGRFGRKTGFVRRVRSALNRIAEKKFVDRSIDWSPQLNDPAFLGWQLVRNGPVGVSTVLPPLSTCVEGTGDQQRVGKKTMGLSIQIKLTCNMVPTAANVLLFPTAFPMGLTWRFALVLDREPNTTTPQAGDIWLTPFTNLATVSTRFRPKSQRFRILMDETMVMSAQVMCPCTIERFLTLPKIVSQYNGTGDTFSDINLNCISLWCCPNVGAVGGLATNFSFTLRGETRFVFTDV